MAAFGFSDGCWVMAMGWKMPPDNQRRLGLDNPGIISLCCGLKHPNLHHVIV
jgi:hypothetical protein